MSNTEIFEKICGITGSSISWQYIKAIGEVDKKEVLKTVNT